MSKYTVVGDLHITPKNLDKCLHLFEQIENLGNPTIFLGDQLDTKEIIRGRCLNTLFEYFKNSKLDHIVLIGNHCYFNLDCEDHSQEVLKLLPNVTIVDKLTTIDNLNFIPYIHNQEKLKAILKEISEDSVLFGHLEVSNFDYGNGFICENGINYKDLSKFKRVISGHFHKHQEKENLIYLGTPFSHSFGESNQDKFLGSYDSESDELELIPTNFPQHITKTFNCDTDNIVELDLQEIDYNRVILTGSIEAIEEFDKSLFPEVKFIEKPITPDENIDLEIDERLDLGTQFKKWASEVKEIDDRTIELGLSILNKKV